MKLDDKIAFFWQKLDDDIGATQLVTSKDSYLKDTIKILKKMMGLELNNVCDSAKVIVIGDPIVSIGDGLENSKRIPCKLQVTICNL